MKLSVIVAVYNEEDTIIEILNRVQAVSIADIEKEIIVVNDGSSDSTKDVIDKEFSNNPVFQIIHLDKNKGKGHAVRKALNIASGDIILTQDADLEYDPNDYPVLIQPIIDGQAKVVYGSRWIKTHLKDVPFSMFKAARWFITFLTNLLYETDITDEPTGYKVFHKDVLSKIDLKCTGFEFCPEITAKVAKLGFRIFEVPISYNPRTVKEGKKIKFRDGVIAVYTLIKYRILK